MTNALTNARNQNFSLTLISLKMIVVSMYHIHLFMIEYDKNMTMSYHASFPLFCLYYATNLFDLFEVKWLKAHIFHELFGCKYIRTKT